MAVCQWCDKEMTKGEGGCTESTVKFPDDTVLDAVPNEDQQCGDCKCAPGTYHHPGCDRERCPRCGGQLISCPCLQEEDEE